MPSAQGRLEFNAPADDPERHHPGSGQTCSAGSRLLIERSVYGEFVGAMTSQFAFVTVGTPEIDFGWGRPSARSSGRMQGFIDCAQAHGLPLLGQGRITEGLSSGGFLVRPTLFGAVPRSNALAREEVFGPVLAALPFEDEDDAVRLADATDP